MTRGGNKQAAKPIRRRRCAACGCEGDRSSFLRVVRHPTGEVAVSESPKDQGRGAYICRSVECVRAARKKNALSRALKHAVPIEVYDVLERVCTDGR